LFDGHVALTGKNAEDVVIRHAGTQTIVVLAEHILGCIINWEYLVDAPKNQPSLKIPRTSFYTTGMLRASSKSRITAAMLMV